MQGVPGLPCELKASIGKLASTVSKLKMKRGRGPRVEFSGRSLNKNGTDTKACCLDYEERTVPYPFPVSKQFKHSQTIYKT